MGSDQCKLVLDDVPADMLSYHGGTEEKIGTLSELWPECVEASLFGIILQLSAEAWQVGLEDLTDQDEWHHKGNLLWGQLSRP